MRCTSSRIIASAMGLITCVFLLTVVLTAAQAAPQQTATPKERQPAETVFNNIQVLKDRGVAGIKMPFKWVLLWQSGKNAVELTDVQPNVAINATRSAAPPKTTAP